MKTTVEKTIYIFVYLNTYFLSIFEVILDIYIVIHAIASETAIFRHHCASRVSLTPSNDAHTANSNFYKPFSVSV